MAELIMKIERSEFLKMQRKIDALKKENEALKKELNKVEKFKKGDNK